MSVIPIDEAALSAALSKHRASDNAGLSPRDRLSEAVSAYLEAVGARVEYGFGCEGAWEHAPSCTRADQVLRVAAENDLQAVWRLTTSWKLLTDTEEETDG